MCSNSCKAPGTATFQAVLTVVDANGCSHSISQTVSVLKAPNVGVKDQELFSPFSNCSNSPTNTNANYTITVLNDSQEAGCISSYSINWGDGVIQNNVSFPLTHTYTTLGAFTLTVTATGSNGCTNSKSFTKSH